MDIGRRSVLSGAGSLALMDMFSAFEAKASTQATADAGRPRLPFPVPTLDSGTMNMVGGQIADPKYKCMADQIVSELPVTTDHVAILRALADLKDNAKYKGPNGESFCERWQIYANPLIVRMWHDLGYQEMNDCNEWCAITIGWCLKRSGRTVPAHVESSQSFAKDAHWGTVVATPQVGDIVVFADDSQDKKWKGHGHVTIFEGFIDANSIWGIGGNQSFSKTGAVCTGYSVRETAILREKLKLVTTTFDAQHLPNGGWHRRAYIRPPLATGAPLKDSPPKGCTP